MDLEIVARRESSQAQMPLIHVNQLYDAITYASLYDF